MSVIAQQSAAVVASCHLTCKAQCRSSQRPAVSLRPFQASITRKVTRASTQLQVVAAEVDTSTTVPAALPPLPPLDAGYEAACAFAPTDSGAPFANWIIPGAVMLGRYPYVEPSRCLTRNEGDRQIEAILRAGITTFVCLQAEIPPQLEMRLAGVNGFLPYRSPAQIAAAVLSDPPTLEEISALRTPELDRYLPPRPRGRVAPYATRHRIDPEFLYNPITDLSIPEEQQLAEIVEDIKTCVAAGQKLYVHCWGGRGRAGTVGAALLASMYGMGADEALERVQRAFDTRKDEQRRSPETDEQRAFVRRFIESRQG